MLEPRRNPKHKGGSLKLLRSGREGLGGLKGRSGMQKAMFLRDVAVRSRSESHLCIRPCGSGLQTLSYGRDFRMKDSSVCTDESCSQTSLPYGRVFVWKSLAGTEESGVRKLGFEETAAQCHGC